ncbi:MAG TPA: hypothetical protein VE093_38750 [Polyangiaceae bacterium]|jgi:hypothetical protein|nr:hypothetical protein [Polyangiaceae bacterium]
MKFRRVRRRKHVRVSRDDKRWRLNPTDVVRKIEIVAHRDADLVEQPRKILRPGRDALIHLVHRRLLHHLGHCSTYMHLLREELRIKRASPQCRRNHNEFVYDVGMPDSRLQSDPSAERKPHHVCAPEVQVPDERRDVIRHRVNAERCHLLRRTVRVMSFSLHSGFDRII